MLPEYLADIRTLRFTGLSIWKLILGLTSILLYSVAGADDCPTLTYSAIPLGRDKSEVLSRFRAAGCEVHEKKKGYPDGLFLIDSESIHVKGLPAERTTAKVSCACWAHIKHADLVFGAKGKQPLYLVERQIDEDEKNPQKALEKFRSMLDPLLGDAGKPRFQDHRVKELGTDYRYRTHFMYWYDWRRDVRSYLIIKEVKKEGAQEVYVGHIWMPEIESATNSPP